MLPFLNRARLSYAARAFAATGAVPGTVEGNQREPLMPWADPHRGRLVLGATVEEACGGPAMLRETLDLWGGALRRAGLGSSRPWLRRRQAL